MPVLATQSIYAHCIKSLRFSGGLDRKVAAVSQDHVENNKVGQKEDESGVSQRIRVRRRL
jgi:hypothetical protein